MSTNISKMAKGNVQVDSSVELLNQNTIVCISQHPIWKLVRHVKRVKN